MDKKEAGYVDMWPTADHMRKGRVNVESSVYKYKKVNLKEHLARLRPNYFMRPEADTKAHKPKMKKYQTLDKTDLKEL